MRRRVLLADAEAGALAAVEEAFAEHAVEVRHEQTDQSAYNAFIEWGPDLLVLDVLLPRQGGLALLRRIRGTRGGRELPAVVTSGVRAGHDLRIEAVERLEALALLPKPLSVEALRRVAADALRPAAQAEGGFLPLSPSGLVTRGTLAKVGLPVVLQELHSHRCTGCLNLRHEKVKKIVYLQDGAVVFARSNQVRETLGRTLVDRGRLELDTYRMGLEAMVREKKLFGEFLVESGALEASAVFDAVRTNVLEKVLEVFSWTSGDFALTPYEPPPTALPGPPFPVSGILWHGVRERLALEQISAAFEPFLETPIASLDLSGLAEELALDEGAPSFLRVLKPLIGRSLKAALSELRSEEEVRWIYYLLLRGRLRLSVGVAGGPPSGMEAWQLERVRRARRMVDDLAARNYFQVLEVPVGASDGRVREGFLQRAKELHPDLLGPGDPEELRRIHNEAFQLVQAAYQGLKTAELRREYLRFIEQGFASEVVEAPTVLEAEAVFQAGLGHWRKRAWESAAMAFGRAYELNPSEGEYALYLARARATLAVASGDAETLDEAETLLRRAAYLLPGSAEARYRLGRLLAQRGRPEEALEQYRDAVSRDPEHVDSLRELRLARLRAEKKAGRRTAGTNEEKE